MRTTVVVIGGGQAGLATSWWLTRGGVDHIILEQGTIAQSWRTRRWNSLRLLTPNWMSRLPGHGYDGGDPDGYQRAGEVVAVLDAYARSFAAPLRPHTTVLGVAHTASGFQIGRPGAGEELLTRSGFVDIQRYNVPFAMEFADPEIYARSLAATGPAHEAIQTVGEQAFHHAAVQVAAQRVRAGLPLRAEIAVTGYLARKSQD